MDPEPAKKEIAHLIDLYNRGQARKVISRGTVLAKRYPDVPLVRSLLGAAYAALGQRDESINSFEQAIAIDPDNSATYFNFGNALMQFGLPEDALARYQKVLQLKHDFAEVHNNMGVTLMQLGRYQEAVASYHHALDLKSDYADAHNNLGNVLKKLGKHDEAIISFRNALRLDPGLYEAQNNLGASYRDSGLINEALACYKQAIAINPDYAEAHHNLGNTLVDLGRRDEAIASFRRAVDLDSRYLSAYCASIYQLAYICDWEQIGPGIQDELKALEFGPSVKEVTTPFSLLPVIDDGPFLRRVAEAYARVMYPPNTSLGQLPLQRTEGRIRIGYYSADFHDHATMHLMAELFERHDQERFEVRAFSFGPDTQDAMRTRLLDSVEHFHDVRLYSDRDIAALSRSLGIDIAVDLKGYTKQARTGIFACRAAPVQVSYLGYPGTMGAPFIDYLVADPVLIPPEAQLFYSEKIVYLPDSYQVNDSRRQIAEKTPSRAEAGLPETGFVFCCFNNSYKIMPDVFVIWMRLLAQVPGSVLWLFKAEALAEKNLLRAAQQQGIDSGRLVFAEKKPLAEHLARCRLADLFLDTFNVNAHTTASDALWVGLPLLTKLGESFASRVAGSLLHAVGLPELVTTTHDDYEALALRLALNPDALQAIRTKLAANRETAPLFDAVRLTRHLEDAYIHMFEHLNSDVS